MAASSTDEPTEPLKTKFLGIIFDNLKVTIKYTHPVSKYYL